MNYSFHLSQSHTEISSFYPLPSFYGVWWPLIKFFCFINSLHLNICSSVKLCLPQRLLSHKTVLLPQASLCWPNFFVLVLSKKELALMPATEIIQNLFFLSLLVSFWRVNVYLVHAFSLTDYETFKSLCFRYTCYNQYMHRVLFNSVSYSLLLTAEFNHFIFITVTDILDLESLL